ncbi:MAG: serine/threonine-protein kinase [Myxococcota bacterium]
MADDDGHVGPAPEGGTLGVCDTLPVDDVDGVPPDWRTASTEARANSLSATLTAPDDERDVSPSPPGADDGVPESSAASTKRAWMSGSSDDRELYDPDSDEDPLADPLVGLVVAERYRIVERIGRGGMGIVYRVQHTKIGKLLAMKLLAGELAAKQDVLKRFKREAMTVSKLSNPHTVQVFDYGVWNHLTYLVMELVEGMDLGHLLKRHGPLPFARVGRLMVQVCSSLAEAHEKGITHRDIKPENIMIIADAQGVEMAKVLDFGLAKLKESAELNEVTLQGAVVGTPYYISPEQVYGEEVDGRSDIYSLGTVMFRALTGTYPFQAKTPMGMFTKHLTESVPQAEERAPELEIPPGVSAAVARCMAKEPDGRFSSIESLRETLLDELNTLPLSSQERLLLDSSPRRGPRDDAPPSRRIVAPAVDALDAAAGAQLATRAELEAYERKLRRNRFGAVGLALLVLVGVGAGVTFSLVHASRRVLAGRESEPNDRAQQANALTLGASVTGQLGRRIDKNTPDRDFFRFEVPPSSPAGALVRLEVTALPNLPMCALLYRVGYADPSATYCTGVSQRDLRIERLRLDAGDYFLAVTQDLISPAPGEARYPVENISDRYRLEIASAVVVGDEEVEPNDTLSAPQMVLPGATVTGGLAWVGDRDVWCTPLAGSGEASSGPVTWSIEDETRPEGTVLEVVPHIAGIAQPLARIHPSGRSPKGRPRLDADVSGMWTSPVSEMKPDVPLCVVLRLTRDPWVDGERVPTPSAARYRLSLARAVP